MLHSDTVVKSEETSFCLLNNCMQRSHFPSLLSTFQLYFSMSCALWPRRSHMHDHNTMKSYLVCCFVRLWHHDHVLQGNSSICFESRPLEFLFLFAFCVAIKSCIFICKFSFNTCCTLAASISTISIKWENIALVRLSHAPARSVQPACLDQPALNSQILHFYFMHWDTQSKRVSHLRTAKNENKWDLTRSSWRRVKPLRKTMAIISRWFFNIYHSSLRIHLLIFTL